jgi:cytochrome c oxidase subunit I
VVYRWAYDYSLPGAKDDFVPQNVPADQVEMDDTGSGETR